MLNAPRSVTRRYALRDKVQLPNQCPAFAAVVEQLVFWKNDLGLYVAAGGGYAL